MMAPIVALRHHFVALSMTDSHNALLINELIILGKRSCLGSERYFPAHKLPSAPLCFAQGDFDFDVIYI